MNREKVKALAIVMVKKSGLINLSRKELCEAAGVPDGSFPHVMGCNFAEFVDELQAEGVVSPAVAVSKTRVNPTLRKEQILTEAVSLSIKVGYHKITRDTVADSAGVSVGLVTRYFGTMNQLKTAVMRAAVKRGIPEIVAQGLAHGDNHAKKAPTDLKEKAAAILSNS